MADQYKVVYDLSIGAIFSDLERPSNPDFNGTRLINTCLGLKLVITCTRPTRQCNFE